MNPRQWRGVALLAVSILGAVAVFVGLTSYTGSVARRLGPTRPVLTLARDVPAFQQLTPSDLVAREVPQMYTTSAELGSFDDIAGRVPAVRLPAGALLQTGVLVDVPEAGPGEREMTVEVGVADSVAAELLPLDRVDIVAAYRSQGSQPARAALTVSGARVLRLTPIPKAAGVASDSALAVTFALTPKQVRAVALAQTVAAGLRLALQPRDAAPDLGPTRPAQVLAPESPDKTPAPGPSKPSKPSKEKP